MNFGRETPRALAADRGVSWTLAARLICSRVMTLSRRSTVELAASVHRDLARLQVHPAGFAHDWVFLLGGASGDKRRPRWSSFAPSGPDLLTAQKEVVVAMAAAVVALVEEEVEGLAVGMAFPRAGCLVVEEAGVDQLAYMFSRT